MPERPLLLVDVDGVLSLFGQDVDRSECVGTLVEGVPHFLSRRAAAALAGVAPRFECVWCTGWEDRAGSHLPQLLELPVDPALGMTEEHSAVLARWVQALA